MKFVQIEAHGTTNLKGAQPRKGMVIEQLGMTICWSSSRALLRHHRFCLKLPAKVLPANGYVRRNKIKEGQSRPVMAVLPAFYCP